MALINLEPLITVSEILSSNRASNGTITLQIGDAVSGEVDRDGAEYYGVAGLAARPANPANATTASAECISLKFGDRDLVVASRDIVSQSISGSLNPGETCLYAPGETGTG